MTLHKEKKKYRGLDPLLDPVVGHFFPKYLYPSRPKQKNYFWLKIDVLTLKNDIAALFFN